MPEPVNRPTPHQGLNDLIASAQMQQRPSGPGTQVWLTVGADDWVDVLIVDFAIPSDVRARAERTNPTGEPVWRYPDMSASTDPRGAPIDDVLAKIRELPGPSDPKAPRVPLPDAGREEFL